MIPAAPAVDVIIRFIASHRSTYNPLTIVILQRFTIDTVFDVYAGSEIMGLLMHLIPFKIHPHVRSKRRSFGLVFSRQQINFLETGT